MRMPHFVFALVFTAMSALALPALAAPSAGTAVQKVFSTSSVGTTTWVSLVSSTVRGIKGISVYNSAPSPIEVGVAFAGSAADSEVRQTIIPGLLTGTTPVVSFYPMAVGYGARISIRALGSTASTGQLDMSLFYN